jgi:hypothetical protein
MSNALQPKHHYQPKPEDMAGSDTLESLGFYYEGLPGEADVAPAHQTDFEYPDGIPESPEVRNHGFAEIIQQAAAGVVALRGNALAEGKLPAADSHNFRLSA